jgi:hypothetical protein
MTHTGEEWFQIGWPQYAFLAVILFVYLLLVFRNKLPSMKSFQEFADTINSAGGHIIILSIFSGWFFITAMRFFFHVLGLPDELITKRDAIVMTGVGFVTGTAFGGAWGALIKTMSGGKANGGIVQSPVPDSAIPDLPARPAAGGITAKTVPTASSTNTGSPP